MSNSSNSSNQQQFPQKYLNKLPVSFKDAVDSMSEDEIKKRIVEISKAISSFEKDMDNDSKLLELKEQVKELADTYKVPIKEHHIMIKYLVYMLEQRGTP